jgi:hypothetical protein
MGDEPKHIFDKIALNDFFEGVPPVLLDTRPLNGVVARRLVML